MSQTRKSAFCIGAVSSGSGKTTLTLGLLTALKKRGIKVQPFKCGPDYIDPGFHREACGIVSRNLDTWMMGSEDAVKQSFTNAMQDAECAVIEGVMGLFDASGPTTIVGSTAHVAKTLSVPVILVVNCRGIAGTIAPLIKGFIDFEEGVTIAGIIANNVGSAKHADLLREALTAHDLPPLFGFLPRNDHWILPERHLGLVPDKENSKTREWYDQLGEAIEEYVDIDAILDTCTVSMPDLKPDHTTNEAGECRLAYAYDEAFHFYYQDNLDMLAKAGITLVPFSPVNDSQLPDNIKGIYMGGGFPEMFAEQLSQNTAMRTAIKQFSDDNGFIFAECGGFMYLTQSMEDLDGNVHPMCDVFPVETRMEKRLHRLGYIEARFLENSPFGPAETICRGHEFHWSSCSETQQTSPMCEIRKSRDKTWQPTGCHKHNTWASYAHVHFASNPAIPDSLSSFLNHL